MMPLIVDMWSGDWDSWVRIGYFETWDEVVLKKDELEKEGKKIRVISKGSIIHMTGWK